jgi:hypothetical protein
MERRIEIVIEGTTPLLCNRFTDEVGKGDGKLGAIGDKGTPREQAETKLYRGLDGSWMIPQPNLFRCFIDAGKFFKMGKSKVTTQKSSLIPACLEIEGVEIRIEHREPWTIDTRAVRIPSTGGRILCHRPCFHDWRLSFTALVDLEMISLRLFREIVDKAGKAIGLGEFRPDNKGPLGRFVVTRWAPEA